MNALQQFKGRNRIIRAAAYARFSSDNQRDESIDAQLRAIYEHCERNNIKIIAEYIDKAKSGTNAAKRQEFQRMIKDSSKGRFDLVIVHKLDRFARNRYDSAHYKFLLKKNNVKLRSVIENLDDSPESIIMESVLEGMAEYYSKNLAREVKKGLYENAYNSKYTGGKVTYGYIINPNTFRYELCEEEAENVRLVFKMYANGRTYSEILAALEARGAKSRSGKPFTKNALGDMLENEKYTGIYVYNARQSGKSHAKNDEANIIRVPNGVPQIIDSETFIKAQERKNLNRHGTRSKGCKHDYLLTGLVKCGCCGHAMTGDTKFSGRNKLKYVTYRCGNRYKADEKCKNKAVNLDYQETFALDLIADRILSPDKTDKLLSEFQKFQKDADKESVERKKRLKSELASKETEIENLMRSLEKGIATEHILSRVEHKSIEIDTLKSNICEIEDFTPKPINKSEFNKILAKARTVISDRKHPDELKALAQSYIKEIKVNEDNIDVVLTFHKLNEVVAMVGGDEGN